MHAAFKDSRPPASRRGGWWFALAAAMLLAPGIARPQTPRRSPAPTSRPTSTPKATATAAASPVLTAAEDAVPADPTPTPPGASGAISAPEPAASRFDRPAYSDPYDSPVPREAGGFGWGAISVLLLLTALAFAAAWWFLLRPMTKRLARQGERLGRLVNEYGGLTQQMGTLLAEIGQVPALRRRVSELESRFNQLADEISPPVEPPVRPTPVPLWPAPARPQYTERPTPAPAQPFPPVPAGPPPREEMGALFIQEIKASGGLEAATVWERYFARLQKSARDVRHRQLYWDRGAAVLRFQDRPSDGYIDTAQCWLVQADMQSLVFFPALTLPAARKKDLPGCQIISTGDALLDLSKLWAFTPPVVAQSTDGWVVRTEGVVEYH